MGTFLSELKKEMGEPAKSAGLIRPKSPLRVYIESNYDDIMAAKKEGYTNDQLRVFINKKLKSEHSKGRIGAVIYHVTSQRKPAEPKGPAKGFYFDYSVDGREKAGWVSGTQSGIDKFLESLKIAKPGSSVVLLSARPMLESEWEKTKRG